jgi:FtsZ-interacting cell division protein ZipA
LVILIFFCWIASLNELTELINGELTDNQRRTMASLAVQDVHYRDIIEEMAHAGVENINDFKW